MHHWIFLKKSDEKQVIFLEWPKFELYKTGQGFTLIFFLCAALLLVIYVFDFVKETALLIICQKCQ